MSFGTASTLVSAETQQHPVCSITGEPLPPGSVIELGTFDQGTIFDLFAGRWRPLALRIHDHPSTSDAGFYNTVSHPAWWFREPKGPSPAFVFMNLDDARLSWESGPDGAFRTVLPTGHGHGMGARVFHRASRALAAWRRARKN